MEKLLRCQTPERCRVYREVTFWFLANKERKRREKNSLVRTTIQCDKQLFHLCCFVIEDEQRKILNHHKSHFNDTAESKSCLNIIAYKYQP